MILSPTTVDLVTGTPRRNEGVLFFYGPPDLGVEENPLEPPPPPFKIYEYSISNVLCMAMFL
jgi:hypothetical protein